MQTINYKGYELRVNDIVTNPNGRQTQTVLIYKDNECITATFADIQNENAIEKAKGKINKLTNK